MNRRLPLVPILLLLVPWFFASVFFWQTVRALDSQLALGAALYLALLLLVCLIWRLIGWLMP